MATILIVDDEPILRQLFQKVLEHEGHVVLTAANGRDALCVMREQVPDLIMLDMMMPTMDGTTFLRLMRRHPEWARIPVVIMSAVATEANVRNVGALGVKDYLLKGGFSLPALRARIRKYLEPIPAASDATMPDPAVPDPAASEPAASDSAPADPAAPDPAEPRAELSPAIATIE
jgi:CheY-like chemotaxis protein